MNQRGNTKNWDILLLQVTLSTIQFRSTHFHVSTCVRLHGVGERRNLNFSLIKLRVADLTFRKTWHNHMEFYCLFYYFYCNPESYIVIETTRRFYNIISCNRCSVQSPMQWDTRSPLAICVTYLMIIGTVQSSCCSRIFQRPDPCSRISGQCISSIWIN